MTINRAHLMMHQTIDALACSPKPFAERLQIAFTRSFSHALLDADGGDYLPEGLAQRMGMLRDRMTSADVATGSVHATLAEMDDDALIHCAREMVGIALDVLAIDT